MGVEVLGTPVFKTEEEIMEAVFLMETLRKGHLETEMQRPLQFTLEICLLNQTRIPLNSFCQIVEMLFQ